jgi:hypothetical protein
MSKIPGLNSPRFSKRPITLPVQSTSAADLPALLSFFTRGQVKSFLPVPDIGSNSGFPGEFDWNDPFDDDDGAWIMAKTSWPELNGSPMIVAVNSEENSFASLAIVRTVKWDGDILVYRIEIPKVVVRGRDRLPQIHMELSAAFASLCLQMKTDWQALVDKHKSREKVWTIRPEGIISSKSLAARLDEIMCDAACRFYDECDSPGNFSGFAEPIVKTR